MNNLKAVLVDKEWFQIYDNLMLMTDTKVASGIYWNYNLNIWKTVSSSPFSNALVYVANGTGINTLDSITLTVTSVTKSAGSTIITLEPTFSDPSLAKQNCGFAGIRTKSFCGSLPAKADMPQANKNNNKSFFMMFLSVIWL